MKRQSWRRDRKPRLVQRGSPSTDGKPLFEVEDATLREAGMVGLWTKANSVTAFDEFSYGEKK